MQLESLARGSLWTILRIAGISPHALHTTVSNHMRKDPFFILFFLISSILMILRNYSLLSKKPNYNLTLAYILIDRVLIKKWKESWLQPHLHHKIFKDLIITLTLHIYLSSSHHRFRIIGFPNIYIYLFI